MNVHCSSEPDARDPRASFRSDRACLGVRALSSHDLEWPLGLFLLVVSVVWIIGVATLTLFLKPHDPPSADRTS